MDIKDITSVVDTVSKMKLGHAAVLVLGFGLGMWLGDTGSVAWNLAVFLSVGLLLGIVLSVTGKLVGDLRTSSRTRLATEEQRRTYQPIISAVGNFVGSFPKLFKLRTPANATDDVLIVIRTLEDWWNSLLVGELSQVSRGEVSRLKPIMRALNGFLNRSKLLIERTPRLNEDDVRNHYNECSTRLSVAVMSVPNSLSGIQWDDNKEIK